MEKIKEVLKLTTKNQVKWIILVVIISVVLAITGIIQIINYAKAKATLAKTGNNEQNVTSDSIIEQENLVTTSSMSAEELKKLNEQEMKKLEEEEKKNEQNNTINTSMTQTKPVKNKYYIKVNYGAQTVTIYTYDKKGNYTVPVKACVCSTGAATPTSGVYRISWKAVWGKLFGNVWGHYSCQIVGDILFHSVPYNQARNDTLVSAYYDRLGTKDSMGCIRLTTIDAKWIYDNCPSGTQVEFYSSSNPGPLGKPYAQKVSKAPGKLKNWDPTDPDPKNPWRTYKPKDNNTNSTNKNNTTNSTNTNDTTNNTQTNNTITNTTTNITGNTQTNSTANNVVNNTTTSGQNVPNDVTNNTQNNLNNTISNTMQNNTTTSNENNQNNNNNTNSNNKNEQTSKENITNNEL